LSGFVKKVAVSTKDGVLELKSEFKWMHHFST
jgi:hypothetical protein